MDKLSADQGPNPYFVLKLGVHGPQVGVALQALRVHRLPAKLMALITNAEA